jgi:hypothetical protein
MRPYMPFCTQESLNGESHLGIPSQPLSHVGESSEVMFSPNQTGTRYCAHAEITDH